jgi:hypothetical protein
MEQMSRSNSNGTHFNTDDDDDEPQDEIAWLHGRLLGYKVVNGKPLVLVPWYPTCEPPDEYSKEEIESVKRQYESQTLRGPRNHAEDRL